MGGKVKEFPDLLELLYDVLLCPERWNDFLGELCRRVGCDSATLTLHDSENQFPRVKCSVGISQEQAAEWNTYYGKRNPRSAEVRRAVCRNGSWLGSNSLCHMSASYREHEYVQWLERCDFYHSMLLAVQTDRRITSLSLVRPKSAKQFPQRGLELMHKLLPHLQRVLQIHIQNETLNTRLEAGTIALDKFDTAVVAIDRQGRVVPLNERAENFLRQERGLSNAGERMRLERRLTSAVLSARALGTGDDAATIICRDDTSAAVSVIVTPFRTHRDFAEERPCALAFVCDPQMKPLSRAALLRELYRLTPAECRLAGLLHEGLELRAAAERMAVTGATARFMLKRIFRKAGCHRQTELVALLNRLPGRGSG